MTRIGEIHRATRGTDLRVRVRVDLDGRGDDGVNNLVGRDEVVGAQFHPERSRPGGFAPLGAFTEGRL